MSDPLTFNQMAAAIMSHPDCAVDLQELYVGSTHLFVKAQTEIIRSKLAKEINLKHDRDAARAKRWLSEVLIEIEAGRPEAVKPSIYNPLT